MDRRSDIDPNQNMVGSELHGIGLIWEEHVRPQRSVDRALLEAT